MYPLNERVWFEINGDIEHGTIIAYSNPKDYKIRAERTGDVAEVYAAQIKGSLEESLEMSEVMGT